MAGHALRGAATAWLALIALQAVASSGTGRVASFFGDVDQLVRRALDPTVPAIPDRRGSAAPSGNPYMPTAPGQQAPAAAGSGGRMGQI